MDGRTFYIILSLLVPAIYGSNWSYSGDHSPEHWKDLENSKCGQSKQSPINIDTSRVKHKYIKDDFKLKNFDKAVNVKIANNGHTLNAGVTDAGLMVSGGGLSGEYKTLQFHFHWGSNNTQGSEHTLNNKTYPMEMHVVNQKTTFASITEALEHPDGLTVLGFFFEVSNENNTVFQSIVNTIPKIPHPENTTSIVNFKLRELLPTNLTTFYRYDGSLTTPNCNEAVVWTVFYETIKVSNYQLDQFRQLYAEHNEKLVNNFRPVQKLGERTVFFRSTVSGTSQISTPVIIPPLVMAILLNFFVLM